MKEKEKLDSLYHINKASNTISANLTTAILKKSDALAYHSSLPTYKPSPLIYLPNLAEKYKVNNIYFKDESFRFGLNAFKGLGASYAMAKIIEAKPEVVTFCTATDGNHGRAVAWSAHNLHKESVIFVPRDTTAQRIKAIEKEGAKVIQIDGNYDEAYAQAEKMSAENGLELVQDTAWENYETIPAQIMAGYLTLFKEMEDSLHPIEQPKIDIVFLQAGVGSFAAAGIFYYLSRYGAKRPRIVIVEPKEADGILESFKNDTITTSKGKATTIIAGLNCGTPSLGAWDLLKHGTDVCIKIEDSFAKIAMRDLYFPIIKDDLNLPHVVEAKIIAGEAGAGGLAGFIAIMSDKRYLPLQKILDINEHTNILFINTEGATDIDTFNEIVSSEGK